MKKPYLVTALALVALAAPLGSLAQGAPPEASSPALEALLVEFANTPSEHRALATYYRGKAADARAEAASHRSMAKHYGAGKLIQRDAMKKHCEGLAQKLEGVAAEYDQLAAAHEKEATR